MADLIEILESFNRKERFFLLSQALGQCEDGKPKFKLDKGFQKSLSDKIGLAIPDKAFMAMDYHLNWIHASLVLAHYSDTNVRRTLLHNGAIKGNQEDADLLVAFNSEEDDKYHLLLVEAKAFRSDGYAPWLNSQLESKVERLRLIFNDNGDKYYDVVPHYCLTSHSPPQRLDTKSWPEWMRPYNGRPVWLKLDLPPERLVVKYNGSVWNIGGGRNQQIVTP